MRTTDWIKLSSRSTKSKTNAKTLYSNKEIKIYIQATENAGNKLQ